MTNQYRVLPSVDKVLASPRVAMSPFPRDVLRDLIRQYLESARSAIATGGVGCGTEEIVESVLRRANALLVAGPRHVINATGVILHTNLGRAPLSREAIEAMGNASAGYCDLEFDLDSGKRGSRTVHVEELLCQLTGAEAALVVNNNAAGVVLALSVLARRKEVIVSRGEAVEIGGGFRIPDVMRQSGAKLVEVGTTNCTYRTDYDAAITSRTAALMRVHSSNFRVMGFTRGVALEDLAVMARQREILLLDDQGSGCFVDTAPFGLAPEPLVQDSVVAGSSLVCFSGDKLVGGPQAGVVVGRRELIDKMRRHPLMRAMRLDRIRLAALSATLIHYLKGEAMEKIPVWRMIATPLSQLEQRTRRWVHAIDGRCWITDGESVVGGGSLPGATLPTKLVAVRGGGRVAESLRRGAVPVIGRVEKELLLLDPRTVLPEEDSQVIEALKAALT